MPFGHKGHSGHVNPSPAAEMYPPKNISEYNTIIVANARYWIAKIFLFYCDVANHPRMDNAIIRIFSWLIEGYREFKSAGK